jgi:hypothetical protein
MQLLHRIAALKVTILGRLMRWGCRTLQDGPERLEGMVVLGFSAARSGPGWPSGVMGHRGVCDTSGFGVKVSEHRSLVRG